MNWLCEFPHHASNAFIMGWHGLFKYAIKPKDAVQVNLGGYRAGCLLYSVASDVPYLKRKLRGSGKGFTAFTCRVSADSCP